MSVEPTLSPTSTPNPLIDVRVSRWALLDAFSSVARDGTFSSKIARPRDRFLRVADQVCGGAAAAGCMVCVAWMQRCEDLVQYVSKVPSASVSAVQGLGSDCN